MTDRERTILYFDHVTRAGGFAFDKALCRWSISRHARRAGRSFIHLEIEP